MLGKWEYANRGRKKIGDDRGSQTRKAHLTSVGGIEPELLELTNWHSLSVLPPTREKTP